MAFAGALGARVDIANVPCSRDAAVEAVLLFSESNTRFLCEVPASLAAAFEAKFAGVAHARIGEVTSGSRLEIVSGDRSLVSAELSALKTAWLKPLDW
jgi:phosphoribosylformylglycinamidine synthase